MDSEHTVSALDVAAAIIQARPGLDQLQLHKWLYLVQASNLAWFKEPAYREDIEAWNRGPVTRRVAGYYMKFGMYPIHEPESGDPNCLSERLKMVVESVLETYGHLDGSELAALIKADPEAPWRQARGRVSDDEVSDAVIPISLMEVHHRRYGVTYTPASHEEMELAERYLDGDDEALADLFEQATGNRPTNRS